MDTNTMYYITFAILHSSSIDDHNFTYMHIYAQIQKILLESAILTNFSTDVIAERLTHALFS